MASAPRPGQTPPRGNLGGCMPPSAPLQYATAGDNECYNLTHGSLILNFQSIRMMPSNVCLSPTVRLDILPVSLLFSVEMVCERRRRNVMEGILETTHVRVYSPASKILIIVHVVCTCSPASKILIIVHVVCTVQQVRFLL